MEPFFPIGSSLYWVLGAFSFFLIAFHIFLVFWLESSGWKVVEYIWLGFAALGLFGAAAQVRELAAREQINMFQQRGEIALSVLRNLITLLESSPGPVCRTFVRSEFSPAATEFERIQKEYTDACEWFKGVSKAIPRAIPTPPSLLNAAALPAPSTASVGDLKDMIGGFYKQLGYYNERMRDLVTVYKATQRNNFENDLVFLGPFLLAIALALRITKVTGEIRLSRLQRN